MSKEQILKKAIEKAVKNGWREYGFDEKVLEVLYGDTEVSNHINSDVEFNLHYRYIFSHDFAKAFFPKVTHDNDNDIPWEWHLQQMVLQKDPIKYLEKFI